LERAAPASLLRRFFLVQIGANVQRIIWIDGAFIKLDVLDDAFFIYDDVRSLRPLVGVALDVMSLEDAVGDEHFFVHVAEEGKLDVNLLGKCGVCCGGIHAYAKNCCIVGIDLTGCESSLDRLKLLGSTTGEGKDVDGEKDILLAMEVRKLDRLPFVAEQVEVRSLVADFQGCLGDLLRVLGM
jgi:hypothetical protein